MILRMVCFLFLAGMCQANPIANAWVQKVWERCDMRIGNKVANVRCEIVYQVWQDPQEVFYMEVPIYLPDSTDLDEKKLKESVKCEVQLLGKTFRPTSISKNTSAKQVKAAVCVNCTFIFRQAPSQKKFPVVVTYEQPRIGRTFYYLPQFEAGPYSPKPENFVFYASLADIRGNLNLVSKHEKVLERNPGSIKMLFLDERLIEIELGRTKSGDGR
jgi:hypothetical protein